MNFNSILSLKKKILINLNFIKTYPQYQMNGVLLVLIVKYICMKKKLRLRLIYTSILYKFSIIINNI